MSVMPFSLSSTCHRTAGVWLDDTGEYVHAVGVR